jgi:hypothetical protein
MPHAVWIACLRDGSVRPAKGDRQRFRLPPAPFLRRALREAGGPGFDARVLAALSVGAPAGANDVLGVEPSFPFALPVVALVLIDSQGFRTQWNFDLAWVVRGWFQDGSSISMLTRYRYLNSVIRGNRPAPIASGPDPGNPGLGRGTPGPSSRSYRHLCLEPPWPNLGAHVVRLSSPRRKTFDQLALPSHLVLFFRL